MQVVENLESQRRQCELADLARGYGLREVAVIADDLVYRPIRTVFRQFARHGSGRQVLTNMRKEGLLFPRPADSKQLTALAWRACYGNIINVLQNPFYAGAYA